MKQEQKRDEYLAKIIHDFKTPTIAQIRALELFLKTSQNKISTEEKDLIELTLNSCNYMQNLIETFTQVNKLDYEQLKLNYEKFNISQLLEEIIINFDILLKYNELKMIVNSKKEIVIYADKVQLRRVISNIISNSINHAFKKSNIIIRLEENKKSIIFEAENHSPYIKPENLSEIFEKYKTIKSHCNITGTGLGLYLSREIIKAHFGVMIAKSSQDNINVFGFKIPKR